MELILIAAVSENNVIGYMGNIPWDIKEDRERFRELTIGHCVIMGRKTYESLPPRFEGNGFPNRTNFLVTGNENLRFPRGIHVARNIEEAVEMACHHTQSMEHKKEIYVVGGQKIYEGTIEKTFLCEKKEIRAEILEITKVAGKYYKGDAFFPKINPEVWEIKNETKRDGYAFETYIRR